MFKKEFQSKYKTWKWQVLLSRILFLTSSPNYLPEYGIIDFQRLIMHETMIFHNAISTV